MVFHSKNVVRQQKTGLGTLTIEIGESRPNASTGKTCVFSKSCSSSRKIEFTSSNRKSRKSSTTFHNSNKG